MRTLASALAQEEFDLEVVVVDDGSSDDTAATVAALDDRSAPRGVLGRRVTLPAILAAGDYLLRGRLEDGSGMLVQADLLQVRLRPRVDQRDVELVRSRLFQPSVRWDVEALGGNTTASQ
jgi:glycosyltransferase involved in cell wall biosynthesis